MTSESHSPKGSRRTEAEQARLVEEITSLFEHKITFNEFLGFRIVKLESAPVRARFDMKPELVGHFLYGRLHGGVISSVLDVAAGLAIMTAIAEMHADENCDAIMRRFSQLATIDLRVDYLRQGIGEYFIAEGSVTRLGRRIAVCSMRMENDQGTLIATGNASYIVS